MKIMETMETISQYTRENALKDGVLMDVSKLAKEAGLKWPVAVTERLYEFLDENRDGQSFEGRAWDVLTMLRLACKQGGNSLIFNVIFWDSELQKGTTRDLKSVAGHGNDMEPVITIMFPDED